MLLDLHTKDGQINGQIELSEEVFAVEPNETAMHYAIVVHLARKRQGTHKTKVRHEVSGGNKKPWRQKGRGTARSGSNRSPVWVGGGTVHGPKPHTYDLKIPRKVARLARKSALSLRAAEKNIMVVEDFKLEQVKTKSVFTMLRNLKLDGEKTLILLPAYDMNMYLSARNIPNVSINSYDKVSTYDILCHKKLLLFKGAVESIENSFKN